MIFNWNPDTIRWYREANDYTGFFKNIAALIAPKLAGYATFCDIGCGLGLIDLELCPHIDSITCIDINRATIEALKKRIEEKKITNIKPCIMNSYDIQESWDMIYLSFYGSSNLERFLPHCQKLIAVVGGNNKTRLYPEKYRVFQKNTVDKVKQAFAAKGIAYSLTEVSFEFGQPLRSMEDARNFVMSHSSEISPQDLNDFLSERIVETGDRRYPFYMPHQKSIGIFEIEGQLFRI
jgi:SAM-dependent methyltransferase